MIVGHRWCLKLLAHAVGFDFAFYSYAMIISCLSLSWTPKNRASSLNGKECADVKCKRVKRFLKSTRNLKIPIQIWNSFNSTFSYCDQCYHVRHSAVEHLPNHCFLVNCVYIVVCVARKKETRAKTNRLNRICSGE